MTRHIFIIFLLTTINVFGQNKFPKDSFFINIKTFPKDYKAILSDTNGWKVIAYFNVYDDKPEKTTYGLNSIQKFTPFRQNKMYLKIRGHKIINKGDIRAVQIIKYIDSRILIIEDKWTQKSNGTSKKIKRRTFYRRVN